MYSVPYMDGESAVVDMRKHCAFRPAFDVLASGRTENISSCVEQSAKDELGQQTDSKPCSSLGEPISVETPCSDVEENDEFCVGEEEEGIDAQCLSASPSPMEPGLRDLIRNEANIRQLEAFVGTTCALINSTKIRQYFLGPVYSRHPTSFKLPAGVVCGLRLAIQELKQKNISMSFNSPLTTVSDATVQTEISFPTLGGSGGGGFGAASITSSEGSPPDPPFANAPDASSLPPPAHISVDNLPYSDPPSMSVIEKGNLECKRVLDGLGGHFSMHTQPQSQQTHSKTSATLNENIDVERLIHHSSASACRLAARQFVNANLVRGQHFDMKMEVSGGGEGGQKRVTGIFYCHLCREKRERTCAVRFSVARNRYPVMSNVLSHLKTHFQYQSSSATAAAVGVKKLPPSVSPPVPMDSTGPFLSPTSFCNLMSRVVQFAASANTIPRQSPLASPIQSKLSSVN
uniref:Sal-like protein 2 n=1 Tax=Mesocestoides corti TaxID=53468 RepID=A0A5K3EUL9_MESCO